MHKPQKEQDKRSRRQRRARRMRMKARELGVPRLTVHRTPRHTYAQIIVSEGGDDKVVAQASTLDKTLREQVGGDGGKVAGASAVGRLVAERAVALGLSAVAFDRAGYKYHGRVKALAEGAREAGLTF